MVSQENSDFTDIAIAWTLRQTLRLFEHKFSPEIQAAIQAEIKSLKRVKIVKEKGHNEVSSPHLHTRGASALNDTNSKAFNQIEKAVAEKQRILALESHFAFVNTELKACLAMAYEILLPIIVLLRRTVLRQTLDDFAFCRSQMNPISTLMCASTRTLTRLRHEDQIYCRGKMDRMIHCLRRL